MGAGVVLVGETQFGIGHAIGRRSDVGAHPREIGLEGQHIEIAHHLHVLAAFVSLGHLDFDGRGVIEGPAGGANPRLSLGCFDLAELNRGNPPFNRPHAIEVFVELALVGNAQCSAQIPGAAQDQIEHRAIQRIGGGGHTSRLAHFAALE